MLMRLQKRNTESYNIFTFLIRLSLLSSLHFAGPQSQRHSVGYLPRSSELYAPLDNVGGRGYYDYPDARSSGSVTPTMENMEQR